MDFAEKFHELGKGSDINKIASQFKKVDSSVIDMAKSVKDGSMSMDDFKSKTLDATTASSKFSRMAKTAGTWRDNRSRSTGWLPLHRLPAWKCQSRRSCPVLLTL